jgi:hypothetical protein
LAGIKKITVERSYKQGYISAKLAAAMAQVLEVDPYYLTGETDEQKPYDYNLLREFVTELGYDAPKKKIKRPRKNKVKDLDAVESEQMDENDDEQDDVQEDVCAEADPETCCGCVPDEAEKCTAAEVCADEVKHPAISEDELFHMLKNLLIQAKYNNEKACVLSNITSLLLK